jgi:hypothetical protein
LAGNLNTWTLGTGSVDLRVLVEGKKITILFNVDNTSTGGGNNTLTMTLTGVSNFKQTSFNLGYFNTTGTTEWVLIEAVGSTSDVRLTKIGSSFGTYTNTLDLKGQIIR